MSALSPISMDIRLIQAIPHTVQGRECQEEAVAGGIERIQELSSGETRLSVLNCMSSLVRHDGEDRWIITSRHGLIF